MHVCPGVCVSHPFSLAWRCTRPGLMSGNFCKVAFSRWHKRLYIYLLPLVGLDQCVAKHACAFRRVSFMCLGP